MSKPVGELEAGSERSDVSMSSGSESDEVSDDDSSLSSSSSDDGADADDEQESDDSCTQHRVMRKQCVMAAGWDCVRSGVPPVLLDGHLAA